MVTIHPDTYPLPRFHHLLLGSVAPRPIAFASTVDGKGNRNLAPFSFFNAFGINPPTLIFSPSRRGRDNTTKHTYENIKEVPQVVINVVTHAMVEQVSLASGEFAKGVDEFEKAGFTPVPSELVKPFRVAESPVQFECEVSNTIETGTGGGAGNLIVCKILLVHVKEDILNAEGNIDQEKIDLVGRLGGDYYCRTTGCALFTVAKPGQKPGIGIDSLPEHIKHSKHLTGNELGQLGSVTQMPSPMEIELFRNSNEYTAALQMKHGEATDAGALIVLAKTKLTQGDVETALKALLSE